MKVELINKWGHIRKLLFFSNRISLLNYLIKYPKLYYITSGHGFSEMFYDKKISKQLSQSASFLPDGKMSVIMGFIYTGKLFNQIPGWHITSDLLDYANNNSLRVFILGGDTQTHKLLKSKCENLSIKVDYGHYQVSSDFSQLIVDINLFNPDIILVALGAPKQEIVSTIISENMSGKLILPIGIAINMYLGIEKTVPQFFKVLGLAWLHRFYLSPMKMFPRIISIIKYVFKSISYYSFIRKNTI